MAIPFTGYSTAETLAQRVDVATGYLTRLDAGANPAKIVIFDAADVALVSQNFSDPSGTVNSGTGNITITPTGTQTTTVAGTPSYSLIYDGAGVARTALPVSVGTTPIAGQCVISASPILAASPITFQNITLNW